MPLPPILYEDDALIAFDKPSGLLVAPDRWDRSRSNLMGLVHEKLGPHVANAHRLDAGTSGVIVCAKNKAALDFLTGQFQSKTAEKLYFALAVVLPPERAMKVVEPVRSDAGGLPESFAIELGLGPDEANPGRMRIFRGRGGKPSATLFHVVENFGKFAWIECRPLTGRTHQIRIHLASAGAPVLGDDFYGDPEEKLLLSGLKRRYKGREDEQPLVGRLALHAAELSLVHPVSREPLVIRSPLPNDLAVGLKYLRKFRAPVGRPRRSEAPAAGPAGRAPA